MLCFNIMFLWCVCTINHCIKQEWIGIGWYHPLSEASCHTNSDLTGHMKLMAHDHALVLMVNGLLKADSTTRLQLLWIFKENILNMSDLFSFHCQLCDYNYKVAHSEPWTVLFITAYIQSNFKYTIDLSWCKHRHCCSSSPTSAKMLTSETKFGRKMGQWHMSRQRLRFGKHCCHKQGDQCVNVSSLGSCTELLICSLLLPIKETRCLLCAAKPTQHTQTALDLLYQTL